jgi:hypothetical protein
VGRRLCDSDAMKPSEGNRISRHRPQAESVGVYHARWCSQKESLHFLLQVLYKMNHSESGGGWCITNN